LSLSSEKILRLNDLEFVWDAYEDDWKLGLSKLKKFKNRTGHCLVPHRFKEDGFKLGNWVGNKRRDLKKNILSEMKIESLNALGFYWNPNQEQWIKGFEKLQQFFTREQHCLVKRGHFEGKFNLASWVSNQRSRKDNLTLEQINKLEELGFVWDGHETAWENGLGKLKQFYEREGHCLVVRGHKEDNYKLDIWVTTQRSKKDNLSSERIKRLDALGFSWDPLTEQWEEGLNKLKQFYKREGNCLVPAKHIEDGYKLGLWVSGQRSKKDNLSSERIKRLDALGFVWKRR